MTARKMKPRDKILLMVDTTPAVGEALEKKAKAKGITKGELLARLLGIEE